MRVSGFRYRVEGSGMRVWGFSLRVQGFGSLTEPLLASPPTMKVLLDLRLQSQTVRKTSFRCELGGSFRLYTRISESLLQIKPSLTASFIFCDYHIYT